MDFITRIVVPFVEKRRKLLEDEDCLTHHQNNVMAVEIEDFTELLSKVKLVQVAGKSIRYTLQSPMISIPDTKTFWIKGKEYGRVIILSEEDSLRIRKFDENLEKASKYFDIVPESNK